MDLATGRPFKIEDGLLTADAPVFATIGSLLFAIIPLSVLPEKLPLGTSALWQALPARDVISRVAVGSAVRPLRPPQSSSLSRITMITRISAASAPEDCAPELAVAELCLTTEVSSRSYRISISTFGSTRSMERTFETAVLSQRDEILLAKVLHVEWKYERLVLA